MLAQPMKLNKGQISFIMPVTASAMVTLKQVYAGPTFKKEEKP